MSIDATGNGGVLQTMDETLMKQLDTAGQRPVSIILGCADSRAPIEIMFDVRPGDLFVLRNAGNSVASYKGSIIGSAEYAIGVLGVKLLCVTGHTKCGALTAAVNTVLAGGDTDAAGGSISIVLEDIIDPAKEAVALLPDATVAEQIQLGIKINIFATVRGVGLDPTTSRLVAPAPCHASLPCEPAMRACPERGLPTCLRNVARSRRNVFRR